MNVSRQLDKFYTRPQTAKIVVDEVKKEVGELDLFDLIVEPSAGEGALFDLFPENRLGIEIENTDRFLQMDFLSVTAEEWKLIVPYPHSKVIVIGNPPFGKNGSTALAFLNKSVDIADTICMILPATFLKPSMQNRVHPYLHLLKTVRLPDNSFTFEGQIWNVPTVFQIWKRKKDKRAKIHRSLTHKDFQFIDSSKFEKGKGIIVQRVGARAGQIMPVNSNKASKNYHYIIPNEKLEVDVLLERFSSLGLEEAECKTNTSGMPSISKSEIIDLYSRRFDKK